MAQTYEIIQQFELKLRETKDALWNDLTSA